MTTVYLMRHSEPLREFCGEYNSKDPFQIRNEKDSLSVNGEKMAFEKSKIKELLNIDVLYSSNYARTMCTAKYIALNNGIKINIDERLGERKFGVNSIDELPNLFEKKQLLDFNYKINDGESLNEVEIRMYNALNDILNKNKDKTILIVSHGTAIITLLNKYTTMKIFNDDNNFHKEFYFKNKFYFDGKIKLLELFKLVFDDNNNLISIENIRK